MGFFKRYREARNMSEDELLRELADTPESYEELKKTSGFLKKFEQPQFIAVQDDLWIITRKHGTRLDWIRMLLVGLCIKASPTSKFSPKLQWLVPKRKYNFEVVTIKDYPNFDQLDLSGSEDMFGSVLIPATKQILKEIHAIDQTIRASENLEPEALRLWVARKYKYQQMK